MTNTINKVEPELLDCIIFFSKGLPKIMRLEKTSFDAKIQRFLLLGC